MWKNWVLFIILLLVAAIIISSVENRIEKLALSGVFLIFFLVYFLILIIFRRFLDN